MKFTGLAKENIGWLKTIDRENSGVISSRIRLARNLKDYPFPGTATQAELTRCRDEVFKACDKISYFKGSRKINMEDCSDIDKSLLVERRIISHELAESVYAAGVIIDRREQLSIMINEEDHLRIQFISGGFNLEDSLEIISRIDDELSSELGFAYSGRWGYLTACPTNTGTGMRASCQLHLPGMGMINGIRGTMENINKMGMVVRGLYGEGTKVMGDMLQISNQVTLGISEQHITDSLLRVVKQVSSRESKIRRQIVQTDTSRIKDAVMRSKAVLSGAYKISFEEALKLISNIRFGIYMNIIDIEIRKLNDLMIKVQRAHIQEIYDKKMNPEERDIARAEIIKKIII
ncbi:MAG: protein arginine kinase [Elusimicrobia bacterium]|jgi:protein arginine kinase|nr:protein arginine kinase [Elusimicrobiota bacterium]